jgi:hypothetical protein
MLRQKSHLQKLSPAQQLSTEPHPLKSRSILLLPRLPILPNTRNSDMELLTYFDLRAHKIKSVRLGQSLNSRALQRKGSLGSHTWALKLAQSGVGYAIIFPSPTWNPGKVVLNDSAEHNVILVQCPEFPNLDTWRVLFLPYYWCAEMQPHVCHTILCDRVKISRTINLWSCIWWLGAIFNELDIISISACEVCLATFGSSISIQTKEKSSSLRGKF